MDLGSRRWLVVNPGEARDAAREGALRFEAQGWDVVRARRGDGTSGTDYQLEALRGEDRVLLFVLDIGDPTSSEGVAIAAGTGPCIPVLGLRDPSRRWNPVDEF